MADGPHGGETEDGDRHVPQAIGRGGEGQAALQGGARCIQDGAGGPRRRCHAGDARHVVERRGVREEVQTLQKREIDLMPNFFLLYLRIILNKIYIFNNEKYTSS